MKRFLFVFTAFLQLILLITYGQKISCKIWVTQDYTKLPDSLSIPSDIRCKECSWKEKDGIQINKTRNINACRLTFKNCSDSSFVLKSGFENISLIKSDSKKCCHPYALLWRGVAIDKKTGRYVARIIYLLRRFKAKSYVVTIEPMKKYDLVLLFKGCLPEKGDTIIIDNFLKSDITE